MKNIPIKKGTPERLAGPERREVELFLQEGTIDKVNKLIKVSLGNDNLEVIVDDLLSYWSNDPITDGNPVWFFAVPIEYVKNVKPAEGSPSLIALNISSKKRTLHKQKIRPQKLTPCGTVTTIRSEQVSGKKLYHILNDYGHLMLLETANNVTLVPWDKVIAKDNDALITRVATRIGRNGVAATDLLKTIYDMKDGDWLWT